MQVRNYREKERNGKQLIYKTIKKQNKNEGKIEAIVLDFFVVV